MACVVVLSLMKTLELEFLQPLPRPILQQKEIIPCNKELAQSLRKKLGFLMEVLDENRMDGVEAIKELETKLRDVAFRIEDEFELQVVHLYEEEREKEEEEFRIFEGIFDIFDRIVDLTFKPRENQLYAEMPQGNTTGEKGTHHCNNLHQILHPPTGKSHPCLKFRRILHRAIKDIDAIKEELAKVKEEYELFKHHRLQGTKAAYHVLPIPDADSSHHASHSTEIMVGKQDEFEIVKEMLIRHPSKQLEVVSIKGMGGIGKTTLAKRIYESPSITSYFDKQAWVVASQHHNKRQMLLALVGSKDNADNNSDEDLALQLYQSLKCQRYLVVMDDVWSGDAWDVVKTCFPDDGNGSRVLLTTRLAEVANHICTKDDFSHQMQLLEQSESWKLFNEKACKSGSAGFERIGRPVVEKCKGLPLAIIVVAGLFSKLNTLDEWKNTADALSSSSTTTLDDEECLRIFSLSYNHLPHNLKACFLYLGVFPEDEEIKANDLARLWFAEGLVKVFENESFDAVANRKLVDIVHLRVLTCRNEIELSRARGFLKSRLRKNIELSRSWNLQRLDCYRVSYRSDDEVNYSEFPQLHCINCFYFHGNIPNFVHKLYSIRAEDCSKEYITSIPYLKKVHIESKSRKGNASIANLAYLEQLEGLRISGWHETHTTINNDIVRLKNLRKLTLCDMGFEWEEINILSKLPRLVVLKLEWKSCVGKEWEIQEEVIFCHLIALCISPCDLKHWKASSHNFPKLEHLYLLSCRKLREIPIGFAEVSTLKSIELSSCLHSAVKSAKKIQDEQRDYGNYNMVVIEEYTEHGSRSEESLSEEESELDS